MCVYQFLVPEAVVVVVNWRTLVKLMIVRTLEQRKSKTAALPKKFTIFLVLLLNGITTYCQFQLSFKFTQTLTWCDSSDTYPRNDKIKQKEINEKQIPVTNSFINISWRSIGYFHLFLYLASPFSLCLLLALLRRLSDFIRLHQIFRSLVTFSFMNLTIIIK